MRKLIIFLLLFYASYSLAAPTCTANDINSLNSCLSSVDDGGTIYIEAGTYQRPFWGQKSIDIYKNVTLEGLGANRTDVVFKNNPAAMSNPSIFKVYAREVTFKNLSISSTITPIDIYQSEGVYKFINTDIAKESSGQAHSGIYMHKLADEVFVQDSRIRGYVALNMRAKKITILDSKIEGTVNGVEVKDSQEVLIRNTNALAKIGGTVFTSAAINVQKAQTLKILGGILKNNETSLSGGGTRALILGPDVLNTTLDFVCMRGGFFNIGISDEGNIKNVNIRNSVMTGWGAGGMWYRQSAVFDVRNSCLVGYDALHAESSNNPNNSFLGNYWLDTYNRDLHDSKPLAECPIINDCTYRAWSFDGWDTFRDIDDRNISTKVVNDSFDVKINALNEEGTAFQNFLTGTVCTQVVDESNNSLSGAWQKWNPNDEDSTTINYTVPQAHKNAKLAIVWRYGVDDTCPITDRTETGKMLSTDNFAIRPNDFNITIPTGIQKSKSTINLDFYGRDMNGNRATSYNEEQGVSFRVDINESGMSQCTSTPSDYNNNWRFANGYRRVPMTIYKEGDMNVSIGDKALTCKDRFAAVDCDDKNVSGHWDSETGVPIGYSSAIVKWECPNAFFGAWDSFRDNISVPPSDRNISTKIVNKSFELVLGAMNKNKTVYKDFNGTVCARIEESGNPLASWKKVFFAEENNLKVEFSPLRASKNAKVHLAWKKDEDLSCPIASGEEDNSTLSVDNFAIRPERFDIIAPSKIRAGDKFDIDFRGLSSSGLVALGYNETQGDSFVVNFKERKGGVCQTGVFDVNLSSLWSFEDGEYLIRTDYSEIGIVDINISDTSLPCSEMFAAVDCDDKNVSGRWNTTIDLPIGEDSASISSSPVHFNMRSILKNISGGFTYLANEEGNAHLENMSATLNLDIIARNANGGVTKNYSSACYAKPTDIKISYDHSPITPAGRLTEIITYETNTSRTANFAIGDAIELNAMPTDIFDDGKASLGLRINFDRNYSKPVNPFTLGASNLRIRDSDGVIEGGRSLSGYVTFFYGRVRGDELLYQVPFNGSTFLFINYEIYDTTQRSKNSHWLQNSMQWYRNSLHTGSLSDSDYGRIKGAKASKVGKSIPTNKNDIREMIPIGPFSSANPGVTKIQVEPANVRVSAKNSIHLEVDPWLWHTDTFNPRPYRTLGSCSEHPCVDINIFGGKEHSKSIKSGDINGSDTNMVGKKSQDVRESGVKVFR